MKSSELEAQTRAFYEAVDANDPDAFTRHLTPDATFAFNDVDPVSGTAQVTDFVSAWKGNFAAVLHDIADIAVDLDRRRVGLELVVTYVLTDDQKVDVKGASFLEFQDGQISHWNVYVDTTRLS